MYPRFVAFALAFILSFSLASPTLAEDGYDLWLRYHLIEDERLLETYRGLVEQVVVDGHSATMDAVRDEIRRGLGGILGRDVVFTDQAEGNRLLVLGTPATSSFIARHIPADALAELGRDGYILREVRDGDSRALVVAANEEIGVLYGVFALLRKMQTHQSLDGLDVRESPKLQFRMLNHWDNLDRTVERGYAGFSLWDWQRLPHYLHPRYTDYARANASIGINATALTNVNANADILRPEFLEKAAALADVFRPYGIKVFLTARFSAPIELDGLPTADPMVDDVRAWWREKAAEVYEYIPDFGGFLVKADSEGQPGPHDYGRSQADGANMLAEALQPHGGIVIWRAFVYSDQVPVDRIRQAYDEFKPLDGTFAENVMVQVKNGPLDFQPREPFHPMFGGMPNTPLMMEFQITQEYLGHGTHLAYLAPMYRENLTSDTYADGPGSTVARVIDSSVHGHRLTGIAGVANTGTDRNWTGGHFHQANWYAFGRLAWDHSLTSEAIAEEWIRATLSNHPRVVETASSMMMVSREAVVNYTGALGLHHLQAANHHHGPGPWVDETWDGGRRWDWTASYYHRASEDSIGFDRTPSGSGAVNQYHEPLRTRWSNPETTPDELLLWFHRRSWNDRVSTGRTIWEELVHRYYAGVDTVRSMQQSWSQLEGLIDEQRFYDISAFLDIQEREARWWRDSSVLFFQSHSDLPIPEGFEQPEGTLEEYVRHRSRHVPGI